MPAVSKNQLRESFFEFLFEDDRGYLCLAVADRGDQDKMRSSFRRIFFEWPLQKEGLKEFIDDNAVKKHLWFSVHLFSRAKAIKENAVGGRLIYADLDECDPDSVQPLPTVATESSPGRYHALWKLNTKIPPDVAADYSRRIAYKYSENGVDKSGWDIGQLLRVPYTRNFKYHDNPIVDVHSTSSLELTAEVFEAMEKPAIAEVSDDYEDMPDLESMPDPATIFYKYYPQHLQTHILDWFFEEPDEDADWSRIMWRMINTCLELGMSNEETFVIASKAKCNKYERDHRPIRLLWKEILKAEALQSQTREILEGQKPLEMPELAPEPASETILDAYQGWLEEATDALPIYHELSGFIILSSILASNLRLEASYGTVVPNLWGLILGESTLTRKSTAMTHARDLLSYLDETIEIGSEGSIEGMLQELSQRPRMASMFYRDEVSGFIDAITHKEYLAGMAETLTHLYDAPRVFRRMLKKETVHVQEPVFIFFGGGVEEEVYSKVSENHVTSGFLPRFLVVSGQTDLTRLRLTGPASAENMNRRQKIYDTMGELYHRYNQTEAVRIGNQTIHRQSTYHVELTSNAWEMYQVIESKLTTAANESNVPNLALPTFERLSRSCLKMSMLLAAARQEPNADNAVACEPDDITNAAYYVQRWGQYSIELMQKAGKSTAMRTLERVREHIKDHVDRTGRGVLHSDIMRHFKLKKREMDEVMDSLMDRGEIRKEKNQGKGGGSIYWPL